MSTKNVSGDNIKITKVNVRPLNHSEEWLKEAAKQVEFRPELLETMKDIFGLEKNDLLDIFYDKDQNGTFYKRSARFDLDQTQLIKLQELNDENRTVNGGWKIHEENLKNGTFQLTPDPLMINELGKVINGGHRSKGGVKAMEKSATIKSMPMMVLVNVTEDENFACDQGKSRTDKAVEKMFEHRFGKESRVLPFCKIASTLGYMGASRQTMGLTNSEYYYLQNQSRIEKFFSLFDKYEKEDALNKKPAHRALYLIKNNHLDLDGDKFIEEFFTNEAAEDKLAILRRSIIEKHIDSESKIINKILLACHEWAGLERGDQKDRDVLNLFREKAPSIKAEAKAS